MNCVKQRERVRKRDNIFRRTLFGNDGYQILLVGHGIVIYDQKQSMNGANMIGNNLPLLFTVLSMN